MEHEPELRLFKIELPYDEAMAMGLINQKGGWKLSLSNSDLKIDYAILKIDYAISLSRINVAFDAMRSPHPTIEIEGTVRRWDEKPR